MRPGRSRRRCSGSRSSSSPSTPSQPATASCAASWRRSTASGRRSRPEPFETLVTSISAQQVSLRAAIAIRNRLVDRYGGPRGEHAVGFPARDTIAGLSEDDLFALGFSHRKAQYILALARSELDLGALGSLPDEEIHALLRALPGIGEWTVDWFLARHLARPRAWPAGDLGAAQGGLPLLSWHRT